MADLTPVTRKEQFLSRAAGGSGLDLEPVTREERFLKAIADGGGGGGGEVTPASVALAISRMTDAQAAQALADLGYVVDRYLDDESGNPVRNSVVTGMFAAAQLALTQKANKETVVQVSGTTPTVTPEDNTIYKCGTLDSLTITDPPAQGAYSIVFTSGATATVTTIPASIIFPEAFAAKANTRYEINVLDGYAVVGSWPVPEVST